METFTRGEPDLSAKLMRTVTEYGWAAVRKDRKVPDKVGTFWLVTHEVGVGLLWEPTTAREVAQRRKGTAAARARKRRG